MQKAGVGKVEWSDLTRGAGTVQEKDDTPIVERVEDILADIGALIEQLSESLRTFSTLKDSLATTILSIRPTTMETGSAQ